MKIRIEQPIDAVSRYTLIRDRSGMTYIIHQYKGSFGDWIGSAQFTIASNELEAFVIAIDALNKQLVLE